jgi:hypothetical protein
MNYQLGILGLIAITLLVVDRYVRIQPLLNKGVLKEGFSLNTGTGKRHSGYRCGVDMFPCAEGKRCANGMCISQDTTMPVEAQPLSVYP